MVKMTKHEFGQKCLIILQFKARRNGMELTPEIFQAKIIKCAQLLGATREEVLDFYTKFVIPEVMLGCGTKIEGYSPKEPTEREAWIAARILKIEYFWDLKNLRREAYNISEKISVSFKEAAAIITNIATKHLWDQFGEGDEVTLEITDDTN